jgi:hypothetical protein
MKSDLLCYATQHPFLTFILVLVVAYTGITTAGTLLGQFMRFILVLFRGYEGGKR